MVRELQARSNRVAQTLGVVARKKLNVHLERRSLCPSD
jgi:hypothetical protein